MDNFTNASLQDIDDLVQRINDDTAKVLLPAIVYIAVLATTGVVGNAMVFYYYCFKTKTVPASVFIVTLAVYDIFSCVICVPTEIVDSVRFYTFTNGAACRVLRFLSYFSSIASGLTLVTIAIDRYKLIRRVSGTQITVQDAKKYCVLVVGIGIILAGPALVIFDAEKVDVHNEYGLNLTGFDCTFVTAKSYQPYVWAFNLLLVLSFFVGVFVLSILYSLVAWAIYKHGRRLVKSRQCSLSPTSNVATVADISVDGLQASDTGSRYEGSFELEDMSCQSTNSTSSRKYVMKVTPKTKRHISNVKVTVARRRSTDAFRVTLVMAAVTIVFVLSFLPYLAVLTWVNVVGKHWGEFSDSELLGYTFGAWSFLYNGCLNPWIYGIFNSQFRQFYFKLLFCRTA